MSECRCKECSSIDCRGCNMFILEQALHKGVFDAVMTAIHSIDTNLLTERLQGLETGKWIKRHYVCDDGKLDTFICSECRYECCYDAETECQQRTISIAQTVVQRWR